VSDLASAHLLALEYLRAGGKSEVLKRVWNGFSVLEVIDAVRRVSGTDFPVHFGPRRAGDPPVLVAEVERIGEVLGWYPRYNDLRSIVMHALNWEQRLIERRSPIWRIRSQLPRSSVPSQVSAVAIPTAREMRRRS
jgi:UDP-glucose 4-epimerase